MIELPAHFKNNFNQCTKQGVPFVFLIDFEVAKPVIYKVTEAAKAGLFFKTEKISNYVFPKQKPLDISLNFEPLAFKTYKKAFDLVQKYIHAGDTFLTNLTFKTLLKGKVDLQMIFENAVAPYLVWYKEKFVCFSPESFIKTRENIITTYPMKGTIDAGHPNASERLLNNKKETNEHHTIVDLLRNDISIIASQVKVNKFKYLEKIQTTHSGLWQMSSEISGILPNDWRDNAVEIFEKILPAGSISGAPKKKTLEIIRNAEQSTRGYYTGIFGYFDGYDFDTAVLIRFIEKDYNRFYYRSGGGITAMSHLQDEYNELIQKIYVPTTRNH